LQYAHAMRLEWIDDILAVLDRGSLARAAEKRLLTQSAFTRRVRTIEESIGVALFDRRRKPAALMPGVQALEPEPYLAYERSSFLGMVVENTVERKVLNAEMIYIDGLVETIKRRLLKGSGFAWLPEIAISAELEEGLLVPIGDASWCSKLTISALSNPATLDQTARTLWDLL